MKKVAILMLFGLLSIFSLHAESEQNPDQIYGIGAQFARLAQIEGSVNIYRDSYEIEKAEQNIPLNSLDVVKTSPDSRAVIQFIDGSLLKLGEDTKVEFLEIDGSEQSFAMIVRLWKGKAYYDISDSEEFGSRTFRIDTENCTVFLLSHGQFRIDKNNFETNVKVVSGKVEIDVDDGAKLIRSGEYAVVDGSGSVRTFLYNTFDRDDFDIWAANSYSRKTSVSVKYVPKEIKHYVYELDAYGTWCYDSDLAIYVWRPYIVNTEWIPYSYGRWVWSPYGMTWVSYYPWGYAPFHYGYWSFSVSLGWVWVPDIWYSPAWVTWTYWDNYIGWHPYYYRRGRVVYRPVRRRIVYAPVNSIYRRHYELRRGVIPSNRRVVTVNRPILPDPVKLRRNPSAAIRTAIQKPITREVITRRIGEIRKNARVTGNERVSGTGRVTDRVIIGNRNSRKTITRETTRPRIINRNGSSAGSKTVRPGNSGRKIRTSPSTSRQRTIKRQSSPSQRTIRKSSPSISDGRVIRNASPSRESRTIRRENTRTINSSKSYGNVYRQKTIKRNQYQSTGSTNGYSAKKTYTGKTYSNSNSTGRYKTFSSRKSNSSRSIRISPKSYSHTYSSHTSRGSRGGTRTIRRR